jgi:Putative bacterial sensory transduction regulator
VSDSFNNGATGHDELNVISPFTRSMIQDHLERNELQFEIDDDGDFRVNFSTNHGFTITALLMADGTNHDVFVSNVVSSMPIPKTLWPKFIFFCNRWNAETRYPKAYVSIPQDLTALYAAIHLEGQFPLSAGVSQAIMDEFINTMLGSGIQFWERVVAEKVFEEMPDDEIPDN